MTNIQSPFPRLRLADHIRACEVDGQVIILDMQSNKYIGIGGEILSTLARLIDDWPGATDDVKSQLDKTNCDSTIASLLKQNILVKATGPRLAIDNIDEPVDSLDAEERVRDLKFNIGSLLRIARAASGASLWLKSRSLEEIRDAVIKIRDQYITKQISCSPHILQPAVASYISVRPFVFTAQDRCLHDSLTLIRFLAMDGLFPQWVVGVKARPFAAHSWVQSGSTVLNDLPENVRHYQPILIV